MTAHSPERNHGKNSGEAELFGVLGPIEVWSAGGEPISVGGPRPRSLLAVLLLDAGRVVSVDRLVDALYGEAPPTGAGNALQSQVSRLRGRLGGLIELVPGGYRLAVEPDSVDVHRFVRLADSGRRALAAGDHAGAVASLREALALWRGPALADVVEAPFAATEVVRLEELRVAAVEDAAEASLALGEVAGLVGELWELVAAYPLRERLRGQLMRALYGAGRAAEALGVFEDGRRMLAEELGADPSPELAAVHLSILRAETPAGRGLPAQLTSFVGREGDLRRVGALLGSTRLVTLVGPGGAGKTRLAVEAAGRAGGEVSFVDLSAVSDGVAQATLSALGLRESGLLPSAAGQPEVADRLVAALAERSLLLVLDNCEHVIAEAAGLAHRLLAECPGLRLLATSREPLGITGEVLHPLASLEMAAAVRLFTERAVAVYPGFVADERVERVCAAVDRLPLAIELAAARLRTLPFEELESRLDDRLGLLSRGARTAPARHQTLRAVVEWSWELLGPDEQVLARRFAVFAGGATAEAVIEVCGGAEAVLEGLVDKSLVDVSDGRYRMLDTIRAFCAERLAEAGEADRIHRAHAEYCCFLGATADPHLRSAEQLEWLERLSGEHGNLRAALRWAASNDTGLALSLFEALSWYWFLSGVRGEVAPLADELLDRVEPIGESYALVVLWAASGRVLDERLAAHVARAKVIMEAVRGSARQPYSLVAWALFAGPPEEDAITVMRELFRDSQDPWLEGLMRFGMGFIVLYTGGALADAQREAELALARFRETGDRWGLAQALDALATFADVRGDSAMAIELTDQALAVIGQLGTLEELADLRTRRADRLLAAGDLEAAHADYERALELARRAGMPAAQALARSGLGEIARRRGDLAEARRLNEAALSGSTMDWVNLGARAHVLTALGRVAEDEGDAERAGTLYREAVELAMDSRMPAAAEEATAGLARLGVQAS
jgi:predicted ATPase/DNA-binding SARP family transcriptional activator